MRISVTTCDGCGSDITDLTWHPEASWPDPDADGLDMVRVDTCSLACLALTVAQPCDLCGVAIHPHPQSIAKHTAWHERHGSGHQHGAA